MNKLVATLRSRSGFVLLLTLCVMLLLFAFGASLLLSSTAALNGVDAEIRQEQAWQYAHSCGELIRGQIEGSAPGGPFWGIVSGLSDASPAASGVFAIDGWDIGYAFRLADGRLSCALEAGSRGVVTRLEVLWQRVDGAWVFDAYRVGGETG